MMISAWLVGSALLSNTAQAALAPECEGREIPADYDEQVQRDFLSNYFALSTTLSPLHAPLPNQPGRGSVGLELSIIPPLNCDQRAVLQYTKTEDTNKSPVLPRPRANFTFQPIAGGALYPYAGVAFVPPIPVAGTYNTIASGEVGLATIVNKRLQLGGRLHGTVMRTVGNIATSFNPGTDPEFDDLYLASSFGLDLMGGYRFKNIVPYVSLGATDVNSFFWIGDNNEGGDTVINNLHPYFGFTGSLGVDALIKKRLRLTGEFYAAPGGYSSPDPSATNVDQASRYGRIYTGRFRIAYEL